jgi:hypothetical protein
MAAACCGRVVSLGAHIVDILGRPVTEIPPGQGRLLLDEIVDFAGTVDVLRSHAPRQVLDRIGRG